MIEILGMLIQHIHSSTIVHPSSIVPIAMHLLVMLQFSKEAAVKVRQRQYYNMCREIRKHTADISAPGFRPTHLESFGSSRGVRTTEPSSARLKTEYHHGSCERRLPPAWTWAALAATALAPGTGSQLKPVLKPRCG